MDAMMPVATVGPREPFSRPGGHIVFIRWHLGRICGRITEKQYSRISFSCSHLVGPHLGHAHGIPMQNIQASNLIRMLHFVMIVVNVSRKAQILRRVWNHRSRSPERSLGAKKLNVTILILRSMAKTPCSYNSWLRRYFLKTFAYYSVDCNILDLWPQHMTSTFDLDLVPWSLILTLKQGNSDSRSRFWHLTLTFDLRPWPLTLKQEKMMTNSNVKQHVQSLLDLDLWPSTLTYNPNLDRVKIDPHAKDQGPRSNGSTMGAQTDKHTNGRTLASTLSPSLRGR